MELLLLPTVKCVYVLQIRLSWYCIISFHWTVAQFHLHCCGISVGTEITKKGKMNKRTKQNKMLTSSYTLNFPWPLVKK